MANLERLALVESWTVSQYIAESSLDLSTLNYLKNIASMASIPISDWPVILFVQPGAQYLQGDRGQINKILFEEAERRKSLKNAPTIPANQLAAAQQGLEAARLAKLQRAEQQYAQRLDQARNYYRSFEDYQQQAADSYSEASLLRGNTLKVEEVLAEIAQDSFWGFLDYLTPKYLRFVTTADVVVRHVDVANGKDTTVNFGKLRVEIDLVSTNLAVWPQGEKAVYVDDYFHPHVSAAGKVCWGNAQTAATRNLTQYKFGAAFKLLSSVLMNYNPDNPYIDISAFDKVSRGHTICRECQEISEDCACTRCDTCERLEEECDCTYCEICETRNGDDCECCRVCSNTEGNCECCGVCNRYDNCSCCRNCDTHEDELELCDECGDCYECCPHEVPSEPSLAQQPAETGTTPRPETWAF